MTTVGCPGKFNPQVFNSALADCRLEGDDFWMPPRIDGKAQSAIDMNMVAIDPNYADHLPGNRVPIQVVGFSGITGVKLCRE